MSAELVPHMLDRVQVRQQARSWKTSDFLLIFVFLDDASKVRSCNVISEHLVLAIYGDFDDQEYVEFAFEYVDASDQLRSAMHLLSCVYQ